MLKFVFSKKATKINEIFTVNLTVTTYCQIDGEDFFNFCGLLRKRELSTIAISCEQPIYREKQTNIKGSTSCVTSNMSCFSTTIFQYCVYKLSKLKDPIRQQRQGIIFSY